MSLSRIWSAFILTAILVAAFRFFFSNSQDDIFGRMVTGTSKDEFKYITISDSTKGAQLESAMKNFAYTRQSKADKETKYIVTDNLQADTLNKLQSEFPALRAVPFDYILGRKA